MIMLTKEVYLRHFCILEYRSRRWSYIHSSHQIWTLNDTGCQNFWPMNNIILSIVRYDLNSFFFDVDMVLQNDYFLSLSFLIVWSLVISLLIVLVIQIIFEIKNVLWFDLLNFSMLTSFGLPAAGIAALSAYLN
jgi:hypothetical protein